MLLNATLFGLALLSLVLLLWQWLAASRFPLHQRSNRLDYLPPVTLLKSLKGCDESTELCLRSWFLQEYKGGIQILFGVASADDPVCGIVRKLIAEFPSVDAQLIVCGPLVGTNLKAAKLAQLEKLAKYEVLVISDADVRVPQDLLANVVQPLANDQVGLVNCFYRLANPTTAAMHWEAVAVNADFWSQVLQSASLKPLDFALGAVMATRRARVAEMGGFAALADCLADDYQLGHRIAEHGHGIALSPVVVECWSAPQAFREVWHHQLRWARTIRVCQPVPYFFSVLSNPTLWPLLWLIVCPVKPAPLLAAWCLFVRLVLAWHLQWRLSKAHPPWRWFWLPPIKDLLQVAIWGLAFLGNRIEWRGEKMLLRRDGTLVARVSGLN